MPQKKNFFWNMFTLRCNDVRESEIDNFIVNLKSECTLYDLTCVRFYEQVLNEKTMCIAFFKNSNFFTPISTYL